MVVNNGPYARYNHPYISSRIPYFSDKAGDTHLNWRLRHLPMNYRQQPTDRHHTIVPSECSKDGFPPHDTVPPSSAPMLSTVLDPSSVILQPLIHCDAPDVCYTKQGQSIMIRQSMRPNLTSLFHIGGCDSHLRVNSGSIEAGCCTNGFPILQYLS